MAPKAAPKAAAPKGEAKAKKEKKAEEPRPEDLIPKVAEPDAKVFEERLQKVQDDIDKLQTDQKENNARIYERSGGKDEFMAQRQVLRAELDAWSAKMDEVKTKKEEIQKKMGIKRQEGIQMKDDLQKMKKSLGYSSEEAMDARIQTIEFKLSHDTNTLKQEKEMLKELGELKKNRGKVSQVNRLENDIKSDDRGLPLKEQLGELNAEFGRYFEEKKKVSEKLKELGERRSQQTGDLPDLIKTKEELSNKIQELIKERNMIKAERRQAEQDFYAYKAKVREVRQERAAEERRKRDEEFQGMKRMRAAEKLDEQPYVAEITLVEQTIAFCKSLVASKGPVVQEEKKETVFDNPKDTVVLAKKEDRDEEMYFAAKKTKKSKSKGSKGAGEGGAAKAIKHNAETFNLFSKLKLDAPITTDDIPQILEKLEGKLEEYNEKVKEWQVKREEMKRKILAGEALEEEEEEKAPDEEKATEAPDAEKATEE